jgi:hypothetical protein
MLPVNVRWETLRHVTTEVVMKRAAHLRLMMYASGLSALLNLCLVLSQFAGLERGKHGWLLRLTDAIAYPPGLISKFFFAPKQHTVHAFALAATESLLCSLLVYALLLWLFLEFLNSRMLHARSAVTH